MNTKRQFLADYQAPNFIIEQAQFYFNLSENETIVQSTLAMTQFTTGRLVLQGENLKLNSVSINDVKLTDNQYKISDIDLTIFDVPQTFKLQISVSLNPEENKSCEGLYVSQGLFCTQCEAESFRKITYFLDRPDVMTKYTVEIEADQKKYPLLLSNGDCVETKKLDNNRHYAKWIDPHKKPSYLFALVAGDLGVVREQFITKSGRTVKCEVYAPHGKQDRSLHALQSLLQAMKWDEDTYGLEYDLNHYIIVSIDNFNMGAMENKGLNIFNSKLVLADTSSATDTDFYQIQAVVGHEYFHNWSGNRVTCRNWFELSLKEGLTVFRDQEFSADMTSHAIQRIIDVDTLKSRQFAEDASPNAHAVRPESCLAVDNFYTATIYEKGAEVIRMLQTLVGKDGFKKGLTLYFKKFDGQAVTIDDFCWAMSEANQINLDQFKLWYSQAGTPTVQVIENYQSESQKYTLTLKQNCSLTVKETEDKKTKKLPFVMPFKMGLILTDGKEYFLKNDLIVLKETEQSWIFENIPTKPVLSLNREFSAPVNVVHQLSTADSLHLIKYDTDSFNRRSALSEMLIHELKRLISSKNSSDANPEIIDVLTFVLTQNEMSSDVKALMLSLPSSHLLAQGLVEINPQAIYQAKKQLIHIFTQKNEIFIFDLYNDLRNKNTIGDRSLKNLLLIYLNIFDSKKYNATAYEQYTQSKNMTDKLAALASLNYEHTDLKQLALNDFYTLWSKDSVVFNKWLQMISTSNHSHTFSDLLDALTKPEFDYGTPNNLYSLHRAFGDNLSQFHKNSANYEWMAKEIIKIDKINPQVAARLANSFSLTPKLASPLKIESLKSIQLILSQNKLSNNTREVLEKYLI